MKIQVDVTQEDIDNGKPESRKSCPIALSLGRQFLEADVTVGHSYDAQSGGWWWAHVRGKKLSLSFDLPQDACAFAIAFDFGRQVQPLSFSVEL